MQAGNPIEKTRVFSPGIEVKEVMLREVKTVT